MLLPTFGVAGMLHDTLRLTAVVADEAVDAAAAAASFSRSVSFTRKFRMSLAKSVFIESLNTLFLNSLRLSVLSWFASMSLKMESMSL